MPDTKSTSSQDPLPEKQAATIRVMAMPADTNASGDIFGGWLMSQVDIAGSVAAYERARGRIVTIAVNEFRFLKPVYVGDLVSIYTKVARVGNTSLQIQCDAYVERPSAPIETHYVAYALITYVAIDAKRNPRPVDNHEESISV